MNIWADILFVICAYLIGTLPHLQVLARLRRIKLEGDYHSSLTQKAGLVMGIIGILGEFIKGALPIFAGRLLDFETDVIAIAGLAAVCGQMWPVFQAFNGEKGNTISLSMSASLAYQPLLIALVPIALGALFRTINRLTAKSPKTGSVFGGSYSYSLPVGIFIGFLVLPFACWCLNQPVSITFCFIALFILLMIRRLTAGLSQDMKKSSNLRLILINRLLLDRSVLHILRDKE
jgi:acyl phosphate:glycerol-3-phosphate acyltransferase